MSFYFPIHMFKQLLTQVIKLVQEVSLVKVHTT